MTEIEDRGGPGGSHVFAVSQHGMNVSIILLVQERVRQYSPEISCITSTIMFHTENLQETHDTMKAAGVFRM